MANLGTESISLVEVGPRDGLQNETQFVPTSIKVELIHRLRDAGLKRIEATSFVSPKAVPALADATEVMQQAQRNTAKLSVLIPNLRGFEQAAKCQIDEIAVFTAASETFNQNNIRCSIKESFVRITPIISAAKKFNLPVRGYVSCALGCPYEGKIDPSVVSNMVKKLIKMGCYEVSLGDTIGVGTPNTTRELIRRCIQFTPVHQLAGHFHDTYGQAIVNLFAAWEMGVGTFDSSIAGLGGCPFAPGASGNVATEDVVFLFNGLGVSTEANLARLAETGIWISNQLQRSSAAKSGLALSKSTQRN